MNIRSFVIFFMLCISLSTRAYSDHRNRKVDSLEMVLRINPPKDKAELVRIYDNLAWGYLETNEKKSMHYADLGIKLSKEIGGYLKLNNFHRIKGMHHWGNARYGEAEKELRLAEDAIKMMRESGKYDIEDIDDQESALFGTFGNLYNTTGEGAKALEYYHKALLIFEKYDWREPQAIAYSCIADLYFYMGNIPHAKDYFHKTDSIAKLTNDYLMQSIGQRGMAKVCMTENNFEMAWTLINKVYNYVFSHTDEEGASRTECLSVMTDIAIAEGDWNKVEALLQQTESLGPERYQNNAAFFCHKAQMAVHRNEWKLAETYALQALDINTDAPDQAQQTYKLLADIYSHLGHPDKVATYMNKSDSIHTAWSNYAYQASLTEQEVRFDTEKKDLTIKSLSNQKTMMTVIVLCCIVLLILMGVITVITRHNHKRQKELIATRVALETETRERQIIAKDLHDGLGGMLSLLKLKIANKEQDEALHLVDESAREMRRVAHHIMPAELKENGLVSSLSNFAISVPGAHFHFYCVDGNEQCPKRLPSEIELVLYRCAYELVNNAMKHSSADRIDIQLLLEKTQVVLTVSDNGKGFDLEASNDGMGLQNIRNRISQYNGRMDIISQPDNGTEINIVFTL